MNAITRLDETIRRRAHTVEINRMLAGGFPYSRNLRAHSSCVNALAFRKDGRFLASAGDDLRIHLWDFHQDDLQSPSFTLQGPLGNVFALAWSSSGNTLYSSGIDHRILIHDISTIGSGKTTPEPLGEIRCHDDAVRAISSHPYQDSILLTTRWIDF
jgi:WD repeat-containing protein 22